MKLLLIWLLGVPVLVATMVLARELPGKAHRASHSSTASVQRVSSQVDFHYVA
ncbi:MAG: hypothetical protein ABIP38_01475 [Steroidobacteraceae bacterium]